MLLLLNLMGVPVFSFKTMVQSSLNFVVSQQLITSAVLCPHGILLGRKTAATHIFAVILGLLDF